MRDIKFRGRAYNGGYVYGYLYEDDAGYVIMCNKGGTAIRLDDENPCICQLVGYDTNGKEVYEGDILIDEDGFERTAGLDPYPYEWSNGMKVYLKGIEGN